jgi:poly-gamma-glutamate capsule biosynthesis protein CapA/YwtB (metallophosphatase superfamily)
MRVLGIVILVVAVGLAAGVGVRYALDDAPAEKVLGASGIGAVPSPPKQVTLVAVGDVLLDKWPGRMIEQKGADYPFEATSEISRNADIAICNLECCVAESGTPMDKEFTFRAKPESLGSLVNAGYDIVTLANNHALDFGREAFKETLVNLSKHGLEYVGAGESIAAAHEPKVLECDTMKVAFLAYDALAEEGVFPRSDVAGIAHVDPEIVRKGVQKAAGMADAVIVYFHWGVEGSYVANSTQRRYARIAADAGADLILGSHPHVVQNTEDYTPPGRDTAVPIVYSLGNFVWGQRQSTPNHSAIFRCTLTPEGVTRYELIPVRIVACQPRPQEAQGKRSQAQHPPKTPGP